MAARRRHQQLAAGTPRARDEEVQEEEEEEEGKEVRRYKRLMREAGRCLCAQRLWIYASIRLPPSLLPFAQALSAISPHTYSRKPHSQPTCTRLLLRLLLLLLHVREGARVGGWVGGGVLVMVINEGCGDDEPLC